MRRVARTYSESGLGPARARPWEPVTVTTSDNINTDPDRVTDADPAASVVIRPDRDVFVTTTRDRTAYHLFPDCQHLTGALGTTEIEDMGTVWRESLSVCTTCERREQTRVVLNRGQVPPNPDPDQDWLPADDTPVQAPSPGTTRRQVLEVLRTHGPLSASCVAARLPDQEPRAVASVLSRLKTETPLVAADESGVVVEYRLTDLGRSAAVEDESA